MAAVMLGSHKKNHSNSEDSRCLGNHKQLSLATCADSGNQLVRSNTKAKSPLGREDGLGWAGAHMYTFGIYSVYLFAGLDYRLCITSCIQKLAETDNSPHTPIVQSYISRPTIAPTPTIHSWPSANVKGKRCSLLPQAFSLINNSSSWQMQRSTMQMAAL